MENSIKDAQKMARRLIGSYMGVKPKEEVFIVVDPATDMIMPEALAQAVIECGAEYTIGIMPDRAEGEKATTCTEVVATGAQAADVYIAMTRSSGASVYDGRIFDRVKKGKLRLCSMVMRDLDNYIKGGALADYEALDVEGRRLAGFWGKRMHVDITSPAGTRLAAEMGRNKPLVECGIAREAGRHMAFSDGEVSQAPNEGTMNGTLVVDGPICQLGLPKSPVFMEVKNGKALTVKGEDRTIVEALRKIITDIPHADNIAEIGIGLNPESLFNGDFEEEKKARGTCHIALGDNVCYGGTIKCDVHLDMETGQCRPSSLNDLFQIARLVEGLSNIDLFIRPCTPMELPEDAYDVNICYAALKGTRKHIIKKVGPGGSFLETDQRFAFMRSEYYLGNGMTDRDSRDKWIEAGSKDAAERAREMVKQMLSETDETTIPDEVDRAIRQKYLIHMKS